MTAIRALIGLGNPGQQYEHTRHNAGAWFIEAFARACNTPLRPEKKFFGQYAKITYQGHELHLLVPTTFMNRSGQAVSSLAKFFKFPTSAFLVAHDELDIPSGQARLKQGGGHGGHNGLRDIISAQGNDREFMRLRLGIDHPGNAKLVTNHVLSAPGKAERQSIDDAIDASINVLPLLLQGDSARAMSQLHSIK
ncbi:aminoacyl-tRNA hydrolase [Larsenimonas suaedae]|uniref:Peptidyl-tRNA hydrolase n=1 Tax=Larsenimonas suaedae TaxID=1851019 RepID=A0ABU1GUL2_9GAMM|nr:aminoacyl-tRNA hydrolase [Larsenimonas suaedae]MCM2970965.1 aminoacyl-tRNA hydrolase [Larsenimonas suaedae]MDR5895674.1 aminoacyl-tRNA hydrolase [Larsenimonas suaedae]